jgi:hypothetical protein
VGIKEEGSTAFIKEAIREGREMWGGAIIEDHEADD